MPNLTALDLPTTELPSPRNRALGIFTPLDLLFLASPRLRPAISQWVQIILLNGDAQAFARAGLCVLLPFGLPTRRLLPARAIPCMGMRLCHARNRTQ